MLQVVLVLALVFAVAIAVFAVQNTTPVAVSFLTWRADGVAASVLVLIAAALGAAVTLLLGVFREIQLRLRLRALTREVSSLQAKVQQLESAAGAGPRVPALPAEGDREGPPGTEVPG